VQKITVPLIATMLILSSFAFVLPANDAYAQGNKVSMCHFPPGNPDNAQTISVSENAVGAHLEHGDFIGTCEDGPDCRNYPEQEACEIKGNLIIHLRLFDGHIPTDADCTISARPSEERFAMDADADGTVVFLLPDDTTSISGTCLDRDSGTYKRFGSLIDPQQVTILNLVLEGV